MRRLVVLGSTGSIGRQALDVVEGHPEEFAVVGLAAGRQARTLIEQIRRFRPQMVAVSDSAAADEVRREIGGEVEIVSGPRALPEVVKGLDSDLVLNAVVGGAGLESTVAALKGGSTVALANKESLVMAGELVRNLCRRPDQLLPVDSEHSAIFQCLQGEEAPIRRLVITGSGGPFRGRSSRELEGVTVAEALAHPTWRMGSKITVDSATLMNKGLEVIEAHFLFDVEYERIEVVIHPQSIIHSLVEFEDLSVKAQLGYADMRLPIQYALGYPRRLSPIGEPLDLAAVGSLTFEAPDFETFACLRYALDAGRAGRTFPAVLSAANEVAVGAFLEERIAFTAIPESVGAVLEAHQPLIPTELESVLEADRWARRFTADLIAERY